MKYKDPITGELKDIIIKSGDTLPIGTIVEIQGDDIPDGYEEVNGSNYVVENTDAVLTNVVSRNIYKAAFSPIWARSNCTVTLVNDEYTFVASGTDMYLGNVTAVDSLYEETRGKLIEVQGGKQITIAPSNSVFNAIYVTAYDTNKKSLGFTRLTSSNYQIPNNAKYIVIRFGVNPAINGNTYKTKLLVSYDKNEEYAPYLNLQETDNNASNLMKKIAFEETVWGNGLHITDINVNAGSGGKTYLICYSTHSSTGDATISYIGMLRCGYNGNKYSITQIAKEGNGALLVNFSVDSNGYLQFQNSAAGGASKVSIYALT